MRSYATIIQNDIVVYPITKTQDIKFDAESN